MQTLNSTLQRGGRGGAVARGTSRGRGRGHNWARGIATDSSRGRGGRGQSQARPRLTHFLAIPLGHLPHLRTRVSAFTTSLLSVDPPILGLDESIIIPARRLHLTLGVMSLSDDRSCSDSDTPSTTLTAALALLNALKPRLQSILGRQPLRVPLEIVDIMNPQRGAPPTSAHVMFAGPDANAEHNRPLKTFCELIHNEFKNAGLVVDEQRPLKLHCTLLNTVYRRPRARDGPRTPFDFTAVLASSSFQSIAAAQQAGDARENQHDGTSHRPPARDGQPHRVDLGSYDVDEVQICLMGSTGSEGEYVSVGDIKLD